MPFLIIVLILFAVLFRREMRGLISVVGMMILAVALYFGVCLSRWEAARGEELPGVKITSTCVGDCGEASDGPSFETFLVCKVPTARRLRDPVLLAWDADKRCYHLKVEADRHG